MSELNSLYAKIHIKKENFDAFLHAKPTQSILDKNWVEWWNSRGMYGNNELTQDHLNTSPLPTNGDIINDWKDYEQSLTFSDYDIENEMWHFSIILFSENYGEMLSMLSFIKSVSEFKEENENDFAIVYDYFWGNDLVMAYIIYKEKQGLFSSAVQSKEDLNPAVLACADAYLLKKWDEYQASGAMDKVD